MEKRSPFFGSTVGRYANRIAGASFELDGATHTLAANDGSKSLHGGVRSWAKLVWEAKTYEEDGAAVGVRFSYESPDGEEGFPGTVRATADYSLTGANELRMVFRATTDKATHVNMCNHAYWNLSGGLARNVRSQTLAVRASRYLPVNYLQIPIGELAPVEGTCMDLRGGLPIGTRMLECDGGGEPGYDHCWVIDRSDEEEKEGAMVEHARLHDPESGRTMVVTSTQPGVQVYTANFLDDEKPFSQHMAVCLATQHFPDSPHHDHFPSTVLRPGETYEQRTTHTFTW